MKDQLGSIKARWIALFALFGVAFSAPLGRLALDMGAQPLAVAFYRMTFSFLLTAILLFFYKNKSKPSNKPSKRAWIIAACNGLVLSLHFIFWYLSLKHTTVFNATVLMCLQPIFTLAGGYLFLGQRTRAAALAGIVIALGGTMVLAIVPNESQTASLYGNVMAALSALMLSLYLLLGRFSRQEMTLPAYTLVVYGVSAFALLVGCLWMGTTLMLPAQILLVCLLLALTATLLGHTLINWALPHTGALFAGVILLGEPVGASIVAYFMFKEFPGRFELLGGSLILIGILIYVLLENAAKRKEP